jgi:hypothetical protein
MPIYTILNSKAEVQFKGSFEYLSSYIKDEKEKQFFFEFKTNGKKGIIDHNGNVIIKPLYDNISQLYTNDELSYHIVELNNKIGYINHKGEEIIPIKYDKQYSEPKFSEGVVLLKINGKKAYFNDKGEVHLQIDATEAYRFECGLALIKKDGLFGYINKTGDEIIERKYFEAYSFDKTENLAIVNYKGGWGIIDKTGNTLVDFNFDKIEKHSFDDCFMVKKGKLTGVLHPNRKKKNTDFFYKEIICYGSNLFIGKTDKLWGVFSFFDDIIIPFEYDEIKYNKNLKILCCRKKKKWNIYQLKEVPELLFTCEDYLLLEGGFIIKQKNSYLLINQSETIQIDIDNAINGRGKYFSFEKDGRIGVMNTMGVVKVPNKYDEINISFDESLDSYFFTVRLNNKFGVIDCNNNFICDIEFDEIKLYKGLFINKKSNLVGYFDPKELKKSEIIFEKIHVNIINNTKIIITEQEETNSIDTEFFVHRTDNSPGKFSILILTKEYKGQIYILATGRISGGLYGEHISKIENVTNWDITKGVFSSDFDYKSWEYQYNGDECKPTSTDLSEEDIKIFKSLYEELIDQYIHFDEDGEDESPSLKKEFIKQMGKSAYKSTTATWYFKNLSKHWGFKYKW